MKELKDKLKSCLVTYVPTGKYPVLYDIYFTCMNEDKDKPLNKLNKNNPIFQNLEMNIDTENKDWERIETSMNQDDNKLMEKYQKLKKKEEATKTTLIESQKKWTNFALDILNISFDLISNMKKLKSGIEIPGDLPDSVNNKLLKYEIFLKKNAEELDKNSNVVSREKERGDVERYSFYIILGWRCQIRLFYLRIIIQ